MNSIGGNALMNRSGWLTSFALLVALLMSGNAGNVAAQNRNSQAVAQAQRAVRQQILNQESRQGNRQNYERNATISFNRDAQSEASTNSVVRVTGSGTYSNSNTRSNNSWSREFTYEATVNNRYRNNNYNNVSGIRYEWIGNDNNDNNNRDGSFRGQSIYCASDDGRRHVCAVNTNGGNVRMVSQKSGSNCVEGRTWGYDRAGIWVDRGCRADFEVSRGNGRYGRNDNTPDPGEYRGGNRPNGRVSYTGPIMNRHSDKALDVTEQGMQNGANIQQWSFADQPNQNWDVIDLGNNEVAIISRHSGRALTVQGGRDTNGANIIQRDWNENPQQRWRLEATGGDYYKIVSVDNGKCLDVTAQGKQNGANVQLWDYANQANQQWRFKR